MTANLVTGLSPMQELKTNTAAGVNPASGSDFSDVLRNSTSKESEVPQPKEPVKKNDPSVKEAAETDKGNEMKSEVKDDSDKPVKVDKEEKPIEDKQQPLSDEAKDEITEAVASMVQTIAEVLEIPAEQVEEAIEDLGMVDMEVLNPGTIPNLVVELTDATDVTEIMTDEELFADVKNLMGEANKLTEEVADALQIPVEEIKSQIGDEVAKVKALEGNEMPADIVVQDKNPEEGPQKSLSITEQTDTQITAGDSEEIAPVSARHEDNKGQDTRNGNGGNEGLGFTQTVTDTLKGMVAERLDAEVTTYATTTDQIMEQVSESLRMTMTEDVTEMEMTLHPASLGNVRVQVAAKDGVITASFTTQNEQVKEVLEAQIIQLKEQMNEQGIKIEAVEVTVGSHAFERNLNDNGDNRGGQPEAEAKKKKVRGINLGGGDLTQMDIEELDEEDKVTADMMARQGNTVDYMA